jgi:hypothetical protein
VKCRISDAWKAPGRLSVVLHEHSDKQEKASYEDKKKDHVVDVVSVFALSAFPQEILDLFVGHV